MKPRCICTRRRVMAKPRPVPTRCRFDVTGLPILLKNRLVVVARDARAGVGDRHRHAAVAVARCAGTRRLWT